MSLQGTSGKMEGTNLQTKGILTKIFKNQQNRTNGFQQQNYVDHLSTGPQTRGTSNMITQFKSPAVSIREHLHTQGRNRGNVSLEPGPGASLGNNQRGGSLNIQELYSHYQKNNLNQNGRNVTYYNSNKPSAHFSQLESNQNNQNNNYVQTQINSPKSNIFVPGSMRFAVIN